MRIALSAGELRVWQSGHKGLKEDRVVAILLGMMALGALWFYLHREPNSKPNIERERMRVVGRIHAEWTSSTKKSM